MLLLFILIGIARLEYQRARLLRYEMGPGMVSRLDREGKKLEAANVAAEVRKLRLNRRFDSLLSRAELRLRAEALVASGLEGNFVKNSAKSSPVELLDMALFGLFLEPDRALYREKVETAKKIWQADRLILKNASLKPGTPGRPTFSAEDKRTYCALGTKCSEPVFPGDLQNFKALRLVRGDDVAVQAATSAGVIEAWFQAVGRWR